MNNGLISREALKKKLQARHDNGEEDFDKGYNIGIETAIDLIDNAPTVEERPQGEWAEFEGGYICSNCEDIEAYTPNFCPNCGACMRKPNCVICDHFGKCEGCKKGEEE